MVNVRVDVWSDIACPWCYVGKRRFERALSRFEHADSVSIVWRSFELDPNAPPVRPRDESYAQRLGKKYGVSTSEAEGMIQRMERVGADEGLELRFDRVQAGNTFDAHRVLHFAKERGVQTAAKERLLRAYFTEGEAIGDREVLARLGSEVGLDASEVRNVLAGDAFKNEVRGDEREAHEHGISGVPFFAFSGKYGVSGAQPADQLIRILERVSAA